MQYILKSGGHLLFRLSTALPVSFLWQLAFLRLRNNGSSEDEILWNQRLDSVLGKPNHQNWKKQHLLSGFIPYHYSIHICDENQPIWSISMTSMISWYQYSFIPSQIVSFQASPFCQASSLHPNDFIGLLLIGSHWSLVLGFYLKFILLTLHLSLLKATDLLVIFFLGFSWLLIANRLSTGK